MHQQVDVVDHHGTGMHRARFTAGDLAQILQVPHVVDFCEKVSATPIAAPDDVLGGARQGQASRSWHGDAALS
jgi:hypothetical protein